jgi:glycosyltransferase involved in cell wall biosynthesis
VEKVVANSRFIKEAILRQYNVSADDVSVVYPPVDADTGKIDCSDKDSSVVVSLGRFEPLKRQMEQIEIAAELPEMQFYICGFVNKPSYYAKCEDIVKKRGLKNVFLRPNVEFDELRRILARARFFIHSLRNEPFGITAVQGIAEGCIPVVHDSGGQMETVPIQVLRYQNKVDAIRKLRELANWSEAELNEISQQLQRNLVQFSSEQFNQEFGRILDEKLIT